MPTIARWHGIIVSKPQAVDRALLEPKVDRDDHVDVGRPDRLIIDPTAGQFKGDES
jgi:hypothetical protein